MPAYKVKVEVISTDELKKLIAESGLEVASIEKGIGMPNNTLQKSLMGKTEMVRGKEYLRTVPTKWVPKILAYIRKKKIEKVELQEEVKEILQEHNIPIAEPNVDIPDKERKLAWIEKMQQVKSELN